MRQVTLLEAHEQAAMRAGGYVEIEFEGGRQIFLGFVRNGHGGARSPRKKKSASPMTQCVPCGIAVDRRGLFPHNRSKHHRARVAAAGGKK